MTLLWGASLGAGTQVPASLRTSGARPLGRELELPPPPPSTPPTYPSMGRSCEIRLVEWHLLTHLCPHGAPRPPVGYFARAGCRISSAPPFRRWFPSRPRRYVRLAPVGSASPGDSSPVGQPLPTWVVGQGVDVDPVTQGEDMGQPRVGGGRLGRYPADPWPRRSASTLARNCAEVEKPRWTIHWNTE